MNWKVVNMSEFVGDELMTVSQIAARLKKAPKTIYYYIETGKIPAMLIIRIGNAIRMRASDLERWVENQRGK